MLASAYDAKIDGIYYNLSGNEATVTYNNDCKYTGTIIIPESVTYNSKNYNVTSIGNVAFYACKNLTSVIIPNSVTIINPSAFRSCSSLTSVTIGSGVTNIGNIAFDGCLSMTVVYCFAANVPYTIGGAFNGSPIGSAILYVPAASVESYKSTSPWSGFGDIKAIPNYILTYIVDGEVYKTYEIEYNTPIVPEDEPIKEGYSFSGWSDLPDVMPAHDVTVQGSFSINSYTLSYMVDGEEYKSYDVEYNATITPEPEPIKVGYTFSGWSEIPETMPAYDVTVTGSFTKDILGTCAKPTISYANGELTFNSETGGVTFHYDIDIEDNEIRSGNSDKVQLSVTYHISVYATKEDYYDSEVATGTLCWIDVKPSTEGIIIKDDATEVNEVKALPVLIQSNGGTITVQGANEGTEIYVYSVNGMNQGSAIATNGLATINTSLQPGSTAIVKIGEKTIKVLIK